jgi:hypothetical protein
MGFMRSLFDSKSAHSDAIDQRFLTQLLIDVAEGRKDDRDLTSFFLDRDWSKPETGKRVVHALMKIKPQRADLYPRAREIVEPIYVAR